MAKDEMQRANSHVGTEKFNENTYSVLDDLFEDENEMFVFTTNRYLSMAAKAYLEDMQFTCYGDDYENRILAINLEEGHFKFVKEKKSLLNKADIELPIDWTDFTVNIESHLKSNPLTKKEEIDFVVNPVTKESMPIDKAMDVYRKELDTLKETKGISEEEVEELFNTKKDKLMAEMNSTAYTSTVDPSISLKNGLYNTILELIDHNGWSDLIVEKYEMNPRVFVNNYGDVTVDIKILTDLGFEYLIKNETIDIVDSEFMNNRSILVKYEGQE